MNYEVGDLVCKICGLKWDKKIIADEDEKRTFENDEGDNKIHRVGPPMNQSDSKPLKIKRNFIRIKNLLSSTNVDNKSIEQTKVLYEKVAKTKNMQGRNINHIILGIFYYVCRKEKCAKTIKEIALMFNVTERVIKKAFNNIKSDIVEPKINDDEINETEKNYIRTFIGGNIGKYDLKMLSFEIVENINKNNLLEGKSPKTIAGLALFLSYKLLSDNLDDKMEFYSMFCNKNTLKKSYDEIKTFLNIIIPQKYTDKIYLVLKNDLFKFFNVY
jgi:transcription initiation factor TFIIIB Brf1 subunit/transcription initiation factor TFIIB